MCVWVCGLEVCVSAGERGERGREEEEERRERERERGERRERERGEREEEKGGEKKKIKPASCVHISNSAQLQPASAIAAPWAEL